MTKLELIARLKDCYPWTKEAAELWERDLAQLEEAKDIIRLYANGNYGLSSERDVKGPARMWLAKFEGEK